MHYFLQKCMKCAFLLENNYRHIQKYMHKRKLCSNYLDYTKRIRILGAYIYYEIACIDECMKISRLLSALPSIYFVTGLCVISTIVYTSVISPSAYLNYLKIAFVICFIRLSIFIIISDGASRT